MKQDQGAKLVLDLLVCFCPNHYFWIMSLNGIIYLISISFFFGLTIGSAQGIRCSEVDRMEFEERLEELQKLNITSPGKSLVEIGKSFLGTAYKAHTLESGEGEPLTITFQGLDCTTFVENVLAFYLLHVNGRYTFDAFAESLQQIRYRDGQIDGYPSRLHYFTEWIADNAEKGLLEDITHLLGGIKISKRRNFMSRHREAYSALVDETNFEAILNTEEGLANKSYHVLEQNRIAAAESALQDGDIIAFATSIDGLDVTHTGLAIRQGDRVHLLHASSSGAVEISKQPLVDYAKGISKNTGLVIARIMD